MQKGFRSGFKYYGNVRRISGEKNDINSEDFHNPPLQQVGAALGLTENYSRATMRWRRNMYTGSAHQPSMALTMFMTARM